MSLWEGSCSPLRFTAPLCWGAPRRHSLQRSHPSVRPSVLRLPGGLPQAAGMPPGLGPRACKGPQTSGEDQPPEEPCPAEWPVSLPSQRWGPCWGLLWDSLSSEALWSGPVFPSTGTNFLHWATGSLARLLTCLCLGRGLSGPCLRQNGYVLAGGLLS